LQSLADSALRAVRKCDPLRIPAQFAPYYNQWKARILRFDPEEMLG
ncbi:MAG: cell envelope biogenesis protein TolA, partial [Beijerinckiaceae bacterium]|nr:cell envelope biogenesis protein TolA [Beijerinckiaceae bacterium]